MRLSMQNSGTLSVDYSVQSLDKPIAWPEIYQN